jgi:hypothetical protein
MSSNFGTLMPRVASPTQTGKKERQEVVDKLCDMNDVLELLEVKLSRVSHVEA